MPGAFFGGFEFEDNDPGWMEVALQHFGHTAPGHACSPGINRRSIVSRRPQTPG
jgi:hypothetical protein